MNLRRRQKAASEVYSHSLNDIMFFLLLFFLITSTLATPSVLKLLLPNSKTGIQSMKHPVVIAVTPDLQFVVNKDIVPREGVEAAVMAAPEARKWLAGGAPKKVIFVPKKIINVVV